MRIATIPRLAALLVLSLLGLVVGPLAASAQVLVYKLQFETTGKTLNYDFYDGGYFICEAPRGQGTFVLTVRTSTNRLLYSTSDGGNLFYIEDGGKRLAVLTAEGGTDGATSSYQATGDIDGARSIGGSISLPYARDLDGLLIASQETGDPVVTDGNTNTVGFAGYSKIKARIDSFKTREYNEDDLTQAEAVSAVEQYLEDRRYKEDTAPTTPATGGGTTTGTTPAP